MADPSLVSYMPLWQSLVGSLGAFAVAAFTVWMTNRHTQRREAKQALRARNLERQRVLREKLEAMLNGCEGTYTAVFSGVHRLGRALDAAKDKRPLPPVPTATTLDTDTSAATVIARLYFPSLAEHVNALLVQLTAHAELVAAAVQQAIKDGSHVAAIPPDVAPPELKALRLKVIDEARKLLDSNFGLDVD